VALKSRTPSDYRVSILQVAGTEATTAEIIAIEERWKKKLQSKEMGLNRYRGARFNMGSTERTLVEHSGRTITKAGEHRPLDVVGVSAVDATHLVL
jgi:hypothetical protein